MDPETIAKETFDRRTANAQPILASKYAFETPIVEDGSGSFCHQLTITRMSDSSTVHQAYYYSVADLDDAISDWRVALGISHMSTAMMGL